MGGVCNYAIAQSDLYNTNSFEIVKLEVFHTPSKLLKGEQKHSYCRIRWPVAVMATYYYDEGMPPRQLDPGGAAIRPLPINLPADIRRVRLCDRGRSCRGPIHCTFPHNQQEMDEWNRALIRRQGI